MEMGKNRLEAFSDAVIAIAITVMVLEMKVPHSIELNALQKVVPVFFTYVLSFIYLAIYWNNHHHMLHATQYVTSGILWANMHLLFWLSLFPFVTGWMGENHFAPIPTSLYGVVLFFAALAYYNLQRVIIASQGENSILAKAIGKDFKGKISPVLYLIAVVVSLFVPWLAAIIYILVALMWLVPDPRIERAIHNK
jgi:uncharacterized membrane protein